MKHFLISSILTLLSICCDSSVRKNQSPVENDAVIVVKPNALPDSLFFMTDMVSFDMQSVPYDEPNQRRPLQIALPEIRAKISASIKEMSGIARTNIWYLSLQSHNGSGQVITVYTENDIDPGSIYLLKLDERLEVTDYKRIGYHRCDLEHQTDTCEVVFCEVVSAKMVNEDKYIIVHQQKREYSCSEGNRKEIKLDSIELMIEDDRFLLQRIE